MNSFHETAVPNVAVVLLGGPLDGERYKMPCVPPEMVVPASVRIPLKQPAAASPYGVYLREGDEPVGGYYVFIFACCEGPDGEQVLYAPEDAPGQVSEVVEVTSTPLSP